MAKSASKQTQEVAFQLAQNWINTNFKVYSEKSAMYEKVSWLGYASAIGSHSMVVLGVVRLCPA